MQFFWSAVVSDACLKVLIAFACVNSLVVGMAFDAGACRKSFVKKNLGGIFWKKCPGDIFDADGVLFVTGYALH